jgi:hypothetical protein
MRCKIRGVNETANPDGICDDSNSVLIIRRTFL